MGDLEQEHGHSYFAQHLRDTGAAGEEQAEAAPIPGITTRRLRDRELLKKRKVEATEKEQLEEEAKGKRQRKGKGTGTGRGRRRGKEPEVEPEPEPEPEPESYPEATVGEEAENGQATEETEYEPPAAEDHDFIADSQHKQEGEGPHDNYPHLTETEESHEPEQEQAHEIPESLSLQDTAQVDNEFYIPLLY